MSYRQFSIDPKRKGDRQRRQRRTSSPGRAAHSPDPRRSINHMDALKQGFENLQEHNAQVVKSDADEAARAAFRHDSTFELVKKYVIYKTMGSNVFINYSLMGMNVAYKLLGIKFTNLLIERTAGSIFTGGVTLSDLSKDIHLLESRGIGGVACYVVEGLRKVENERLDNFLNFSIEAIDHLTKNGDEGHFALKLTAFISTELMEKVSLAQ